MSTTAPSSGIRLHVGRPNIGDRERFIKRINDILDRRWLTNGGGYVTEFERRVAEVAKVNECVAVCNATIGLEIAIRALELRGEVIVPSFTFIATAHALHWQGITPVFCDIDPRTHNLDPSKVEQLITPRTTGILAVHLWGRPCDPSAMVEIANRYNLRLLFDSAHAFGCSDGVRMIGSFGNAEVFSFHATKFINSLEGGAVVTNDSKLAEKMRLIRNYGFVSYDKTVGLGINGKMNEMAAAMGITNLESMDAFIAINRRNYNQYRDELASLEGISVLKYDESGKCNYQYVVIEVEEDQTNLSRDQILQILRKESVLARRYFYPGCHRMEPYRSQQASRRVKLPKTENVSERVLCLPTGTAIQPIQISRVCQIIRSAVRTGIETRVKIP